MVGRPKLKPIDVPRKTIENYEYYINGIVNKTDYEKICGLSRPTLDKYLLMIVT